MKRAIVVLPVLALLTACRQSTNIQWKFVPGIYGTLVPEATDAVVTILAELPQGWEYVAFGYSEKNRK